VTNAAASSPKERWHAYYIGETGFDDRNFNVALSEEGRVPRGGVRAAP
jgi:hypothetical protein